MSHSGKFYNKERKLIALINLVTRQENRIYTERGGGGRGRENCRIWVFDFVCVVCSFVPGRVRNVNLLVCKYYEA